MSCESCTDLKMENIQLKSCSRMRYLLIQQFEKKAALNTRMLEQIEALIVKYQA